MVSVMGDMYGAMPTEPIEEAEHRRSWYWSKIKSIEKCGGCLKPGGVEGCAEAVQVHDSDKGGYCGARDPLECDVIKLADPLLVSGHNPGDSDRACTTWSCMWDG